MPLDHGEKPTSGFHCLRCLFTLIICRRFLLLTVITWMLGKRVSAKGSICSGHKIKYFFVGYFSINSFITTKSITVSPYLVNKQKSTLFDFLISLTFTTLLFVFLFLILRKKLIKPLSLSLNFLNKI